MTELGRKWRKENPEQTLAEGVEDLAGDASWFWTRESLERRRLGLAAFYVLAMPLFTVCIISTVQALRCATPDGKPRRGKKS
jgi:hypothetical protein